MEQPFLATQLPASWPGMEHRCGDRRAANLPVRLFLSPQEVLLGRVRDISLSGAFVQTWRELPNLTRVFVELRSINAQGRATRQRIAACIVRNATTGVGIEWAEFAPASVREHWTALAQDAPESSRTARRRRAIERRILLGHDWLVYYPAAAQRPTEIGEIAPQLTHNSLESSR